MVRVRVKVRPGMGLLHTSEKHGCKTPSLCLYCFVVFSVVVSQPELFPYKYIHAYTQAHYFHTWSPIQQFPFRFIYLKAWKERVELRPLLFQWVINLHPPCVEVTSAVCFSIYVVKLLSWTVGEPHGRDHMVIDLLMIIFDEASIFLKKCI